MKRFSFRALSEPAFGAEPVSPFPANAAMRVGLLVFFYLYFAAGWTNAASQVAAFGALFVPIAMLLAEFTLLHNRHDRDRLFRAWALVLPLDVVTLMVVAGSGGGNFPPISFLTLASILTASAMFQPRYVFALAGLIIAGGAASDMLLAMTEEANTFAHFGFIVTLAVGASVFAVNRGRTESALRQRLLLSEARERDQGVSLREALEFARANEARFQAISEHAPAIIALYDRRGALTFASSYLTREFGVGRDQLPDVGLWQGRIPPDDLARVVAAMSGAVAGTVATEEFALRDATGDFRRMAAVFCPTEEGGAAIIQDVTAERALAVQVQRAQQMETLGTLAGGIAHDFNNLLTAILGNIFLIENGLPAESPLRPLSADARLAGERGAELVRRLLDYSRPQVERREPISIAALITETAKLAQHGLTPQVEMGIVSGDPRATTIGNFASLQQVLLNLMVNARDAMSGGGKLTVTCETAEITGSDVTAGVAASPGPYHAIRVADTGTGIPNDVLPRIFDPFFTTKGVGKGSGLGLPTALSIIRAHGGWLDVETSEGSGSTFRILLPAARCQEPSDQ
jgi:PAS domain S-box-containing protein